MQEDISEVQDTPLMNLAADVDGEGYC